jgi:hypothetical protein
MHLKEDALRYGRSSKVVEMTVASSRVNRFLIATAIGLVVAIVAALASEQAPSAAIVRGDFPAFYTMATLANRGEGARLYDLETQRQVQNAIWPSLQGSVLPAAYPAFLAFWIEPLATLSPTHARIVWTIVMVLCVVAAGALLARSSPRLRSCTWQVIVGAFLFSPLFLGVLGGQIVGVSVLLYAALLCLDRKNERWSEILIGIIAGLWMYKPHFAGAVVVVFLLQRRWNAIGAWLATSVGLWALGVSVAGLDWLSDWYPFVKGFSHIDLTTNAPQMTGVVPFAYVVYGWMRGDMGNPAHVWEMAAILSALLVPGILALAARSSLIKIKAGILPLVGLLLVLFAPAVNFYDLALGALPLILMLRPSRRSDLLIAGGVVGLSQVTMLLKDSGIPGVCFVFAVFMTYIFVRGMAREGAEIGG